jgi:hypothetical protein
MGRTKSERRQSQARRANPLFPRGRCRHPEASL